MSPILYSFRRCPYAMRARMALKYSGIPTELREVKLSDMPACMLQASPKATVPVMLLPDGQVIDESLDVMLWSISQHDPEDWLHDQQNSLALIEQNDFDFKPLLDSYKYADRHPEFSQDQHRDRAVWFLDQLNQRLTENRFLGGDRPNLADFAVFPFIRQFAGVEPKWFEQSEYQSLRHWLGQILEGDLFQAIMPKRAFWKPGDEVIYL